MKKLLIVDDNTSVALVLGRIFAVKFPDFEIVSFTTKSAGVSALNWLQTNQPDYAILDLIINGVNGSDLYDLIEQKRYKVRSVFLTGCSDSDSKLQKFIKKHPEVPVLRKVASVTNILQSLGLDE